MRFGKKTNTVSRIISGLVGLVYLVPLLWIVLTSIKPESALTSSLVSVAFHPTVSSYKYIWSMVGIPILRSFEICIPTVIIVVVLGILSGYGLANLRDQFGRRVARIALLAAIILQLVPQAISVIPLYSVLASWRLINSIPGVVLADSELLLPLAILLLWPFVAQVPSELTDAAQIDGAAGRVVLLRIIVPLIKNGVITVAVFVFCLVWGEFIYAATFINSSDLMPISVILVDQVGSFQANWNQLMALATISSLPIVLVFLGSQRYIRSGLLIGAFR
jgi:multiple sugar transport system permease protein